MIIMSEKLYFCLFVPKHTITRKRNFHGRSCGFKVNKFSRLKIWQMQTNFPIQSQPKEALLHLLVSFLSEDGGRKRRDGTFLADIPGIDEILSDVGKLTEFIRNISNETLQEEIGKVVRKYTSTKGIYVNA